jgi:hypothetical protein
LLDHLKLPEYTKAIETLHKSKGYDKSEEFNSAICIAASFIFNLNQ